MQRIAVLGTSGSGKSTLAVQLARQLGLAHIELDALFHGPDWTPTPATEFQAKLQQAMDDADRTTGGWITCGSYRTASGGINQNAADTIVWLDMSRWLVMGRIIFRTLKRSITGQLLWNGNRESLKQFFKWDPEENIVRWAWTSFDNNRRKNFRYMTEGKWSHAAVHQLRSTAEVKQFLRMASPHEDLNCDEV